MDLEKYRQRKLMSTPQGARRERCLSCRQPYKTCYCRHVKPFDCGIRFVILIHPLEFRRRIATGRLSHMCLENSSLIRGYDYSEDPRVNELIQDPAHHCVILYPGRSSVNLTPLSEPERQGLFPREKNLIVFVIDGTWSTAKKMLNRSRNLRDLPQIAFTPDKPSRFRVRKQPKELCYSSVEAIHQTIELIGPARGFSLESRAHDNLLFVFDQMVEQQLDFIKESHRAQSRSRHRALVIAGEV